MPNKTIYVADSDLPVFQRAQELAGGSLSAAITQALHRYVTAEEAQMQGLAEVKVRVGGAGVRRYKRFRGTLIARWQHPAGNGSVEDFMVYRTAREALAVHRRTRTDWSNWVDPSWRSGDGSDLEHVDWEAEWSAERGESTLEVYESVEAMRERVPPELVDLVAKNLATPEVEDLDI